MKITDISLIRAVLPLDPVFEAAWDPVPRSSVSATVVEVRTDEGIIGYGSGSSMEGFEAFIDLFVGLDPFTIVRHVRVLETISFHAGRYWPLEAALWDIMGKALEMPVATLFGGALDTVAAYASTGSILDQGARVDTIVALKERGFRAAKIRISAAALEEGISTVGAVREAVGPDMELMVDLNQAWRMAGDTSRSLDPVQVRRVASALNEIGVFWLEEPLLLDDLTGLRSVRDGTGIRVAGGEMVRTFPELVDLVMADALDVYQPDVVLAAGMLRMRAFADLVHVRNRTFTPHTWSNGIGLLANLQVTAGVGGGPYLEFPLDPPTWTEQRRDFMLTAPVTVDRDGMLRIPDAPGLGFDLDEDRLARLAIR